MISLGALDDLHILSDNLDELAIQWRGCMRSQGWTAVARAAKAVAATVSSTRALSKEGADEQAAASSRALRKAGAHDRRASWWRGLACCRYAERYGGRECWEG